MRRESSFYLKDIEVEAIAADEGRVFTLTPAVNEADAILSAYDGR